MSGVSLSEFDAIEAAVRDVWIHPRPFRRALPEGKRGRAGASDSDGARTVRAWPPGR